MVKERRGGVALGGGGYVGHLVLSERLVLVGHLLSSGKS